MQKQISEQLYLSVNSPLDAKLTPVNNVSDLYTIPRAHRYQGMTVMVLNKDSEEEACEYWLSGGTKDSNWIKKVTESYVDLSAYYTSAQTDSAITSAFEELREYVDEGAEVVAQALSNVFTSADTESAITEAIEEFKDYVDEGAEVVAQALSNIYTSAETDSAISTAIEELREYVDEGGEVIAQALSDVYTSADTQSAITLAIEELREYVDEGGEVVAQTLANVYTSGETNSAISTAIEELREYVDEGGEVVAQALSNIYTSAETDSAISTALEELTEYVEESTEVMAQAMAAETARTETTYLKAGSLTDYMTISQLNEIFSILQKKPAVIYQYNGSNPINGQTGNLLNVPVWHTLTDVDLSIYSRLRIYLTPSDHNVGLNTNNLTSALVFEISLDNASITSGVPYYSGGGMAPCLNNDDRLYTASLICKNENNVWQIALKTFSLYGTSSTDITDSYIYKIEGIFDNSNVLINPITTI